MYFVFIELCGDKIKKMLVKQGMPVGLFWTLTPRSLPLSLLKLLFSAGYFIFPISFPISFCFSFTTMLNMWSCDYRRMTSFWLLFPNCSIFASLQSSLIPIIAFSQLQFSPFSCFLVMSFLLHSPDFLI